MDSDGPNTVVLTVATADWRQAIDDLEAQCELVVAATLEQAAATAWLKQAEVSLLLTDDRAIRALNARYRQRDKATNVLSFPGLDLDAGKSTLPEPPGSVLLGDIAMSFERLAAEAGERQKSVFDHFAHLLAHGTLHLLGYDHQDDVQADAMEGLEERILKSLGFAAPYDRLADVAPVSTMS